MVRLCILPGSCRYSSISLYLYCRSRFVRKEAFKEQLASSHSSTSSCYRRGDMSGNAPVPGTAGVSGQALLQCTIHAFPEQIVFLTEEFHFYVANALLLTRRSDRMRTCRLPKGCCSFA